MCVTSLLKHSGLTLAFNAVFYSQESSSIKKLDYNVTDTSHFVSVLCLRSKYSGEIQGLMSGLKIDDHETLVDRLIDDIWSSCKSLSTSQFKGALWRATAYLIICKKVNRRLLHAIASSQVELFNTETMNTSIECWKWILTARSDLELSFMQEMVIAWQATFDKKIGLFSPEREIISPLAAYEGCTIKPIEVDVQPHLVWLHFITEMVDTAKYCNRDKVEMLCMLLHRCLPLDKAVTRTRSVITVGCRFKLLQCGLSLLQGNTISKSLGRNILRERIYYYALDYFCSRQMCPCQSRTELFEDIHILLKFWQTMRSEKKHLTAMEVNEYEANSNLLTVNKNTNDASSVTGSEIIRSGSSITGGWYNTIPHSTSTLSRKTISRNKRSTISKDVYDKDYMKKRNLILELLAAELEFLIIWYNPLGSPDLQFPGEEAITEWRARPIKLSLWRDFTKLAWNYNPALAIFLPHR